MISGISNFNYNELSKKFHIIIVSPPFIPLEANEKQLNKQFAYITNMNNEHSYPHEYTENNHLSYHVERLNSVVDFLVCQEWVDSNAIFTIGHSQGARIATKLSSENEAIKALAVLSCDLTGRVTQPIWRAKMAHLKGEISTEDKMQSLNEIYDYYRSANKDVEASSKGGEDSNKNIVSFSTSLVTTVSELSIPVFIGYGTSDPAAWYCDFIPIDFIRNEKQNYLVRAYPDLDHNFMEKDSEGNTLYDRCHWDKVINEFITFIYAKAK